MPPRAPPIGTAGCACGRWSPDLEEALGASGRSSNQSRPRRPQRSGRTNAKAPERLMPLRGPSIGTAGFEPVLSPEQSPQNHAVSARYRRSRVGRWWAAGPLSRFFLFMPRTFAIMLSLHGLSKPRNPPGPACITGIGAPPRRIRRTSTPSRQTPTSQSLEKDAYRGHPRW
jgi:hypothetical protein